MSRCFLKFPRARLVALAVGVGAFGSLATASASFAASPGGTACVPGTSQYDANGGKISGRGSTFQANAVNKAFIAGYTADVCGAVALQYAGDPAATNMISYNSEASTFTGSGNGEAAMACRTDAFGGTDIPYDTTTLAELWGPAGTFNRDGFTTCDTGGLFTPPYSPAPNAAAPFYPSTVGGVSNATANMMSLPVAIGAAAIGVHFTASGCPTLGTQITLSQSQIEGLFNGSIGNWSTLGSTAGFNWSGCNVPVTRVVRSDVSGTTEAVKIYFRDINPSGVLCDGSRTWTTFAAEVNNTKWPGDATDPCSGVTPPVTAAGTGGLINCVIGTGTGCTANGSIGYADLPNWFGKGALLAQLTPSTGGATVNPYKGALSATSQPNCDITSLSSNLPGGGTSSDMVGLNADMVSNWATDGNTGTGGTIPSDITNKGSLYPICTITYDMVYSGLSAAAPGGPIGGLTNNQRRTLYTFFRYVLSSDAQGKLATQGYLAIPSNWATLERGGFVAGY